MNPFELVGAVLLMVGQTSPATTNPVSPAVECEVVMTDGSRLKGTTTNAALQVRSALGKMNVPLDLLSKLQMQPDKETVVLTFRNGDRVSGVIDGSGLPLQTILGRITIPFTGMATWNIIAGGARGRIAGGWRYFVTDETYRGLDDYPSAVKAKYGPSAEVADWNDLKSRFGRDIAAFLDEVGLEVANDGGAFVTRGGSTTYSPDRAYYLTRHGGRKPDHYLAHDQIGGHQASLGSWDTSQKALVRVPVAERPKAPPAWRPPPDIEESSQRL